MENGGNELTNTDPSGNTPEGWYPDGSGQQRYWDGAQWTDHVAPPISQKTDPKTVATVMHISALFLGFIGPLVGYLVYEKDPFIREHSRQALNFQLTLLVGILVSIPLMFIIVGFFTMFGLIIMSYVVHIMAAVAASKGNTYDYPLTIPFLKS